MASNKSMMQETKKELATPSPFGSHLSMIAKDKILKSGVVEEVNLKDYSNNPLPFDRYIALQDAEGFYVTDIKLLNNNMADPNRYGNEKARINVATTKEITREGKKETITSTLRYFLVDAPKPTETTKPTEATEAIPVSGVVIPTAVCDRVWGV